MSTYFPNTFQKPNAFVDKLLKHLTGSETKLLDAATREILGWDQSRATKRARISLTRFMDLTGMSRQTVVDNLPGLIESNVLIPVGDWNGAGQMYELNLGQKGDYDLYYLEHRPTRKSKGNPDPSAARDAKSTKHDDNPPAIYGGEGGLSNRPPESVENPDSLSNKTGIGLSNRPESVYLIDLTNKKQKIENLVSSKESAIWAEVLEHLRHETTQDIFDNWLSRLVLLSLNGDTLTIGAPSDQARDWIANRMLVRIAKVASLVIGRRAVVEIVTVSL